MTASIFVGGKPIDGKLILSDDWRKVCRNYYVLFLCLFEFDSFELPFRLSGVIRVARCRLRLSLIFALRRRKRPLAFFPADFFFH